MKEVGRFDTEIQMFVEPERNLDQNHLEFQRWLLEHGKGEHAPAGPPVQGIIFDIRDHMAKQGDY